MITLVTGFNNTGKSDWIKDQITPKIFAYIKEFGHFGNDDEAISKEMEDMLYHNTLYKVSSDYIEYLCNRPLKGIPFYLDYPENGLHPSLQSKLVEQFIKLHNEGYEVYIETHSDHIVTATRVAIKEGLISSEYVKILFFKAIDDLVEIVIANNGFIANWEKGFCDEYDNQLDKLFK